MKQYTVGQGDTISKIVLREYSLDTTAWSADLFDCLIKYVSVINGKDLALYDNIPQNVIEDPDSLKPGQVLTIPENLNEALLDPRFQEINNGACGQLFNRPGSSAAPDNKKYMYWIGGGLIALAAIYFLTKKKKR